MSPTSLPGRGRFDPTDALHAMIVDDIGDPYGLGLPVAQTVPVVLGVPHAGRLYPRGFVEQSRLSGHALRRSEDAYVDALAAGAVELGMPVLTAAFPRAFVDVNREPYELDPRMFEDRLPAFANTRSLRVAGGLGTIPRIVGDGQEIYRGKLCFAQEARRIERFYRPYHAALRDLIGRTLSRFGHCVLLDLHSMPSAGLERSGGRASDVILGDRFGTSAADWVVDGAERALADAGLSVSRNRPYAGGFITEHYGQPRSGVHVLQIEINRTLYMDEATIRPHAGFGVLREALIQALSEMCEAWMLPRRRLPLAAE